MEKTFKHKDGFIYNGIAIIYSISAYIIGFIGLFNMNIAINIISVLLLGHGMVIGAYLVHECAHNLVFKKIKHNNFLGEIFSWVCGSSYGTYKDIQHKHFRHHVDVDDVVWFDYEDFFENNPMLFKLTKFLEWFYIPAHEFIMHILMMFGSFIISERKNQMPRNIMVIVARFSIFMFLLLWFPRVAILYTVSYIILLTVLRFMDSIQHDYPYNLTLYSKEKPERLGNFEWEQEHTYSNPHSLEIEPLNWLTLNFGFHNVHHDDMTVPWYRLPEMHRELFGDSPENVVPFSAQMKIFHRNRVSRIYGNHNDNSPEGRDFLVAARKAEVSGGNAASFLTSF